MSEKPAAPKRRRLAISLRLLVALIAIFAFWAARVVNKARHQERVVAAIRRAGGDVTYDYEHDIDYKEGNTISVRVPRGPKWLNIVQGWLRDELGVDYVHDVGYVYMDGQGARAAADADLELLGQLEGLRAAYIAGPNDGSSEVTDAGLAHLSRLKNLASLTLHGRRITDAGLAHLKGLTSLQGLHLYDCSITGPGLVSLEGLPGLRVLQLEGNPMTDRGLEYVEGLTQLRLLGLARCPVGDAGLASLSRLPNLSWVNLNVTRVNKEQAENLRRSIPGLEVDNTSGLVSNRDLMMTPPPPMLPPPGR